MRDSDDIVGVGYVGIQMVVNVVGCGGVGMSGFVRGGGVFAKLIVDPDGPDNSVLYTARTAGADGELISVEYAAVDIFGPTVSVTGNAITVTPASDGKMVITGTLSPDITGTLYYAGELNGEAHWTGDGLPKNVLGTQTSLYYDGISDWYLERFVSGANQYTSNATKSSITPAGETFTTTFGTGTPTVTSGGVTTAAQVISAVNADPDASALVTASTSGPSTGPVAQVAADFLALTPAIPANNLTLGGESLTLDGQALTLG